MAIIHKRPEVEPIPVRDMDPILVELLSKCTPHKYEHHIVAIVKHYVKDHIIEEIGGNLLIKVGEKPTSLFSCHMDIIGQVSKGNSDRNKVDSIILMTPKDKKKYPSGYIYGAKYFVTPEGEFLKYGECPLGADDKLGVYILIKMILQNIPGLYVFHVGEECGGIGSRYLTEKHKEKFEGYNRAIAFDRAGYGDIIEFQRGGRCCSNTFGKALAAALNVGMPPHQMYKDNITGTFTDTAMYRDIIPECTNISVGYFNQHGSDEYFDHIWLKYMLLPAILNVDYEKLVTERDPKAVSQITTYSSASRYQGSFNSLSKKSWKEADKDTKDYDLPLWEPKMGYMDHQDDVLRRAVSKYVEQSIYTMADKRAFGEFVFNLLETMEYQDIELEMHKDMVSRLQKMLVPENIKEDPEITKKKDLLTELLSLGDVYELPKNQDIYHKYSKGATHFLNRTASMIAKEQYSRKDLRKLNRTIYMMAYYLSTSDLINDEVDKVLQSIHNYVTLHVTEDGFSSEPIEPIQVKEENVIPFDTGRSAVVH